MKHPVTVSTVKQNNVKVMISAGECNLDELISVLDQAIKGAGFNPKGVLTYEEAENNEKE